MLGVYLCVILPAGMESRQRLVGTMVALVIYIVAMTVYALLTRHIKRTLAEERNYRSQFDDNEIKKK